MKKYLALTLLLLISSGCFKTAGEIEREKRIDHMLLQMIDTQKLLADTTVQTKDLQQKLASVSGQIDETQHSSNQTAEERKNYIDTSFNQINAQLQIIKQIIEKNSQSVTIMEKELTEHREFIRKLTKSLNIQVAKKSPSGNPTLAKALSLYKKKKYKQAKVFFLEVINSKKSNAAQKNKAMHRLGFIEYFAKDYNKAIVYFSKIYTAWPNSSFAPSCIYYIGKSLRRLGSTDQAKASFEIVVQKFATHRLAKSAKKELQTINKK